MHFLAEYGLFLLKAITITLAIIAVLIALFALILKAKQKEGEPGHITVEKLNEKFVELKTHLNDTLLNKEDAKKFKKEQAKKAKKAPKKRNRMFILDFNGDIKASALTALREEVTGILLIAKPKDEVLIRLESPGGMVNAYGLAASQLKRIKEAGLKLTIAVDKMAASGGYMMACVADHIVAAPFAIIGSIGVVAQLPNFHRFLEKRDVDFEQITAGQYKRTLTMLGENTDEGRAKVQEEVNDIHELFKEFIKDNRAKVDIDEVATGEHWFAARAIDLLLIDALKTSDDWLLEHHQVFDLYTIHYKMKKSFSKKIMGSVNALMSIMYRQRHGGGQDYI